MDDREPFILVALSFTIGALGGLAALLRTKKEPQPITRRDILSWMLNSGLFGMGIVLVACYSGWAPNTHWVFVLGASCLVGLGGLSMVEYTARAARELLRAWALRVTEKLPVPGEKDDRTDPPTTDTSP